VLAQLYAHWELCIADDASTVPHVKDILDEYAQRDRRIKVISRPTNGGISVCTNTALEMATGDWIALMDHDDTIAEDALYLIADEIDRHPEAAVIYSDEDHIDERGRRSSPYFKPDWDYDLLLGQNVISHLGAYRSDLVKEVGGFREGYEGSQDWDFVLRIVEAAKHAAVRHVPFVLYHWRQTASAFSSVSLAKAVDSAQRAVTEHLERTGQRATASPEGHSSYLKVRRALPPTLPLVSVVVPTKDRYELLSTCVDGLLNRTDYEPLELVIVDNGSTERAACEFLEDVQADPRVKVVRDPQSFNFSRLVNRGVGESSGEVCVLLNNDVDVIDAGWLREMVSHAVRTDVGVVGAKLYYANDTVQHAGVILGLGGIAGHAHNGVPRTSPGYFGNLNLVRTVSAVTAACWAIRREVYDQVGGLNETDLTVAFNDVDFCLRVRGAGYRIIWTPHAELYHYESQSRGYETTPEKAARFSAECAYMRGKWQGLLTDDPFYSPNLSLGVSYDLAHAPRTERRWVDAVRGVSRPINLAQYQRKRINMPNFVAIHGLPMAGKSTLSAALSAEPGWVWIRSDLIFMERIAALIPDRDDFVARRGHHDEHFSVATYVNSDSYDHALFVECLRDEVDRRLSTNPNAHVVVLDGYALRRHNQIFTDLGLPPERTMALRAHIVDGIYMIEDFDVTGRAYDAVKDHIQDTFRQKCQNVTLPKSTYQNHVSLGLLPAGSRLADSNTAAKFDSSHVLDLIRPSTSFVDVGCNAGYFCFRVAQATDSVVVGVDTERRWLEIASHINNSWMYQANVAFIHTDGMEFLAAHRTAVDVVHCASTYHYFGDRQMDLLRVAREALLPGGKLVLEVELADTGPRPEVVSRSRTPGGAPLAFPNRVMFEKQINGLFRIEAEYPSPHQSGAFYQRAYFHLSPTPSF
jgi:GT2 family glycosyltransferase/SAM-dependent methyltransferase